MEKTCTKCNISKRVDDFPNDPRHSDGTRCTCKDCRKQWIPTENQILTCTTCKESKHHTLFASHGKQKPHMCKHCRCKKEREKRAADRDEYNKRIRESYNRTKDRVNETRRKTLQKRRDEDPKYRVMMALHCRLYMAVAQKKGKTMELTGCSKDELLEHLGSQFTDGMTWENYGTWHIDHIRPCASFDLTDLEQQKICFHWTNLQPLWATDNIKKGSKYDPVPFTEGTLGCETCSVE